MCASVCACVTQWRPRWPPIGSWAACTHAAGRAKSMDAKTLAAYDLDITAEHEEEDLYSAVDRNGHGLMQQHGAAKRSAGRGGGKAQGGCRPPWPADKDQACMRAPALHEPVHTCTHTPTYARIHVRIRMHGRHGASLTHTYDRHGNARHHCTTGHVPWDTGTDRPTAHYRRGAQGCAPVPAGLPAYLPGCTCDRLVCAPLVCLGALPAITVLAMTV